MDRISKFLNKLSQKERDFVDIILSKILARKFETFDIKKLKGKNDEFRIRKGSIRIIFTMSNDSLKILSIERKSVNTYKK